VRGSMKNEERNVATTWSFCKEKHVCVMWKPLFAEKNHGIVLMARSVCMMYRPVGICMFCRPTKRTEQFVKNPENKAHFLKNVDNHQNVDILFYIGKLFLVIREPVSQYVSYR
jgi:hypothetical protein